MMKYILIVQKKDAGIWKDFVQAHLEHIDEFVKLAEDKDEIRIGITPEFMHDRKLFKALKAEKEMGTEFTVEVDL